MSRNLARQIGITLIMCLAVAIMVVAIGFNYGVISADNAEYLHSSQMSAPEYPTNEYGQTYGSNSDIPTPEAGPVLVLAYGDCGTLGYVYAADIDDPAPKTPEEALARQEKIIARLARGEDVSHQVPLYAVDGKTVIGVFTMVSDFSGAIMYKED